MVIRLIRHQRTILQVLAALYVVNELKKTPAMFIEEAIQIHGNDKYDYSQVNTFKDVHTKVSIICKTCNNTFQVTPDKHINDKNGCPTCAGNIKRTTDKFIEIANQNHNNQYLYDKVVYINTDENVIITCKVHGDFLQRPRAHLEGSGCLQCKKANT